jgi:hypothetical protein
MNAKRNIFLIIVITLFIGEIKSMAQEVNSLNTSEFFGASLIGRRYVTTAAGYGSPYLFDGFLNSYVVLTTGDTVFNRMLKFDCYKNELIWMSENATLVSLDSSFISGFSIFSSDKVHRDFERLSLKSPLLADSAIKYIEILNKGEINLYCFRKISTESETVSGNRGGMFQVNKYLQEPKFFIQIGSLPIKQIRLAKNSLVKAYPEYSLEIKRILRENNIGKIKLEWQLIQAVKLINDNLKN